MPLSDREKQKRYAKLYSNLKGYAKWCCGEKHRIYVDELVQHTIVKQMDQPHDDWEYDNVHRWCKRVLKNRFIDILRKHKEDPLDPENPEDVSLADESIGGSNAFMKLLYNKCMDQLKPEHREVMLECILGKQTAETLAKDTGRSKNTILTWLTKAKLQFRDCIEGIA